MDKIKDILLEEYKKSNGCHLSEHLAKMWVDSMVNKDGTQGCQWTVEQTNQYNHNHHKWDWFAIMNMMYSDYYNPKFSASDYADMADAWFNDPDSKDGKTFHYFMHIVL